ncbi:unnamed protein product, partial [Gulo gulo]
MFNLGNLTWVPTLECGHEILGKGNVRDHYHLRNQARKVSQHPDAPLGPRVRSQTDRCPASLLTTPHLCRLPGGTLSGVLGRAQPKPPKGPVAGSG